MALLDSGMGWSADENFMRQSSGKLADLAALVGGPIIPYAATPSDAVANGLLLFHRLDQNYEYYAAVSSPEMIAVCGSYTWQTNNRYFCAFGLANTITVNVYKYNYVTQVATLDQTKQLRTACTIGGTTPAYYVTIAMPNWGDGTWFTPNPEIDNYSTLADLENAISYSATPFYKLNSGYATGCLLKWRSMPSDTVYVSPVLISSSSDNTLLSIDGTTAAPTVSNRHLYQGMWFALRYSTAYNTGDFTNATFPIRDITDTPVYGSDGLFARLAQMVSLTVTDAPDPYGGDAAEEGGDGSDPEDDPVDEETMSLPSVAGLGFCSVYVPSQSELLSLSAYLWSGNFDLNSIIKLFSNPMDSIIGLSAVPVDLAGSPQSISVGGVTIPNLTMPRYTGRTSIKIDMGTVTISERYGSYLDYDPYTQLSIYLPFVGYKSIKADDIMGKTVSLMYAIDILTGACIAYLRPAGGSVLYEWSGQCAIQIPITGNNWDNIFRSAISTAVTLGTAVFAPPSAPVLAGAVASAASQAFATKPRIERSGAVSGVTGFLGQLRPYIVRTIPEAFIPAEQNKQIGYPAYINVSLGSIAGYNEVASIHLENIPATGDELAEIESILKGGAIF